MKKYKNIITDSDCTLTCGISSPILDAGSKNPTRISDNISLVIEDYTGDEEIETVVFLSKENAINLAITLLKYTQKMNTVLGDAKCVTPAVKGDERYTKDNLPIREILNLYKI